MRLLQGKRDECYETRLRIQRVEMNDARHYYLTVENDKGSDSFYVTLTVKGMSSTRDGPPPSLSLFSCHSIGAWISITSQHGE